eukprot:15405278-Alexandrium_andersonii.AAC.1
MPFSRAGSFAGRLFQNTSSGAHEARGPVCRSSHSSFDSSQLCGTTATGILMSHTSASAVVLLVGGGPRLLHHGVPRDRVRRLCRGDLAVGVRVGPLRRAAVGGPHVVRHAVGLHDVDAVVPDGVRPDPAHLNPRRRLECLAGPPDGFGDGVPAELRGLRVAARDREQRARRP